VSAARVLRQVFGHPELRRVQLAFAGFNAAEWGVWIAMLVYAYGKGGATEAGVVAVVQLVPAALLAPAAASFADRHRAGRVLAAGYAVQAAAMGAVATALLAGGPKYLAYALAAVAASAVTATRPAQSALLPSLARRPEELTAANAVSGWVESASVLAGPAAAGVLLAVGGPGLVFAAMAAVGAASALVVLPVAGPPPAGADGSERDVLAGLRVLRDAPDPRVLVGLLAVQFLVIGALDVLYVVLAVDELDLGESWAGYLNAAFGAGGVAGLVATAALVGRARLAPALVLATGIWSAAFVVLAVRPSAAGALLLLVAAGAGRSLLDVAGRTLLQRSAPTHVLARVFGVLEGASMAGLAAGSLLAPALVALGGASAGLLGLAAVLPVTLALAGRRLGRLDARADVPVVEIGLLRATPLFAPLGAAELERVARALEPVELPAGTQVVAEGEAGDRYFLVAEGELEVSTGGRLGRGDGFGELALLADVPRTATVVARSPVRLYALERVAFLDAVASQPASRTEADRLVRERLGPAPARIGP
jgi:MFS family permease